MAVIVHIAGIVLLSCLYVGAQETATPEFDSALAPFKSPPVEDPLGTVLDPKPGKLADPWTQYFWDGRYPALRFLTGMKVVMDSNLPPCRDSLKAGRDGKFFLPVDPYKGQTIMTFRDEGFVRVSLQSGKKIYLPKSPSKYYSSFYVSSNGYITFGNVPKKRDFLPILPAHWSEVRMSVLFTDMFPRGGASKVTWQQTSDSVVVSWVDVPKYFIIPGSVTSTFQVIFHDSGRVEMAWASVGAQVAIVGESYGKQPKGFGKESGQYGGIRELAWCRPQDQWGGKPSSPPEKSSPPPKKNKP